MFANSLNWLGESRIGTAVAESSAIFPWLEVVHVVGIAAMLGSILIVDLRLTGLAARNYPVTRLTRAMLPMTWSGFLIALASGLLMFSSQPQMYWDNWYFRAKMFLLLLGGINMLAFHLLTTRTMSRWDKSASLPLAARIAGTASIAIWVLVVAAGRWIGFTMTPF
jgi:hypothetical protein